MIRPQSDVRDSDRTQAMDQVIGRFAPTPSGRMHMGNAFAALMAWLAVRASGGRLVLRIEDLDPRGHNPQAALDLMDDLRWLGLLWDEGPFWQSKRGEVYEEALAQLAALGLTYPCFCTRAELHAASAPHASDGTYLYAGTCRHMTPDEVRARSALRAPATRLRVPEASDPSGTISFTDLVYGPREEVLAHDCGDFLVRRSDGVMAYQLAVVVDDALMGVNQVVRGCDLLGSTARQMYVQRLLGYKHPTYAHVPLLVAPDGRRLSKRDKDLDLGTLRLRGVRPEQLIGYLASCVGIAEEGEELRADQLVDRFSWKAVAERARAGNVICKKRSAGTL